MADVSRLDVLKLKDNIAFSDKHNIGVTIPSQESHGLWAKTKVMASYDDVIYDKNGVSFFGKKIPTGISELGETIFKTERTKPLFSKENMVPLTGCQYVMERIFEVSCDQLPSHMTTLYNQTDQNGTMTGIGLPDSTPPTDTYDSPSGENGKKVIHYRYGHYVQLFGVGITGTAENDVTVHPVDYRDNSIDLTRTITDGNTLKGLMVPFRLTSTTLTELDRKKYFGKKVFLDTGETGYYLKTFESDPVIKHIWKTGEDIEDETQVEDADIWRSNIGMNAVESFTDVILKITKKDVKEWFNYLGEPERARINTIALFTGQYVPSTSVTDYGDFRDVRLFSKLNIPTEYLSLNKDLNIIYRVYTS